jgi:probable HAF family extracellular repeat protein
MRTKLLVWVVAASIVAGCSSGGGAGGSSATSAIPDAAQRTFNAAPGLGPYTIIDLGTVGGSSSYAVSINNVGWVTGTSNQTGDQFSEGVLWRNGQKVPLGTLGGENSGVNWPNHNDNGLIAGISETATVDPLGEDWSCQAFFPTSPDTKHVCLGFAWKNNVMTPLPTLGGINGYAAGTNDLGNIVGWAETTVHDQTCTAVTKFPQSFYQVLQFEPVIWDRNANVHRLPTLPGDPDGAATAINNGGEIVGISGTCDQAVGRFSAAHAVIWRNGNVFRLPDFGGISWNTPQAISNRGVVVGFDNLPGDTEGQLQPLGFVWSRGGGLVKILPVSGDTNTQAAGVNDLGQVAGVSYNPNSSTALPHAIVWENGKTLDLNTFLPANAPLYLLSAADIDDRGDIVGQALVQATSQLHAFLATPSRGFDPASATPIRGAVIPPVVPANLRKQILERIRPRSSPQ